MSEELALTDSSMALGTGLKVLEREAKSGSAWGVEWPALIKPCDIQTMESVFQPRSLDGRRAEDAGHVKNLMSVIRRDMGNTGKPTFLSPILVWWSGQNWYVIDGHHMRQAYIASGLKDVPVPVECFSGTLNEAITESVRRNTKDRLVMRQDDKVRAAWRLVLTNEKSMSISQIVDAASVAQRTVSNMRKAQRILYDQGRNKDDLLRLKWGQAKALSEGRKLEAYSDDEIDEKVERMAAVMCETLVRHLGKNIITQPYVFAKALLMLEQRLPGWLMESPDWRDITIERAEAMMADEGTTDEDEDQDQDC